MFNRASLRRPHHIFALLGVAAPVAFAACATGSTEPETGTGPDVQLAPAAPRDAASSLQERYEERLARHPFTQMKGIVTTIDGAPIPGVQVTLGGGSAVTDKEGQYTIDHVEVGSYVVSFRHDDFVFAQRRVVLEQAEPGWLPQELLPRAASQKVDADSLSIVKQGPLTLELEPGDLEDEHDHTDVHGEVELVVTAIDPRVYGHVLAAPAPLEGVTASGEQVGLVSFGMLEVELWKDGHKVNVRPGQTVKATMDVSEGYGELDEGFQIPMWHHDTTTGLWAQERGNDARVHVEGDTRVAVAELPHFSAWNYDRPADGVCAPLVVPSTMRVSRVRVVSTDATGAVATGTNALGVSNYWSVAFDCASATNRSSRCAINVPAGSGWAGLDSGALYFKLQAQTAGSSTWCDLSLALNGTTGVVKTRDDVNAYLSANGLSSGSWCGSQTPTGGFVTTDFSFSQTQYTLPTNRVAFGTPRTSTCPSTVGVNAVSAEDAGFLSLATNAESASYKYDFDADGIADNTDKCIAARSANQADADGNGLGDACEPACYVSPDDPDAAWYDFDGDGLDDYCDNTWDVYNPSQY